MRKIHYNKLIRDRIPLVMKKNGAVYRIKLLSQSSFKRELLKKVGEEASSLPHLKKKSDITDELADTLDVIKETQRVFKISDAEIRSAQKKAFQRKGGFRKKYFLFWSQDTGYRTNERRNKSR